MKHWSNRKKFYNLWITCSKLRARVNFGVNLVFNIWTFQNFFNTQLEFFRLLTRIYTIVAVTKICPKKVCTIFFDMVQTNLYMALQCKQTFAYSSFSILLSCWHMKLNTTSLFQLISAKLLIEILKIKTDFSTFTSSLWDIDRPL